MTVVISKEVQEKGSRKLITGNEAVAEAVKLAKPKVVPAYPITPQTAIVEAIADMVANKQLDAEYVPVESEHSAMSAAIGASLGGVRTFTATSSQGLLYMGEMVYWAGFTRIPIVMAVVNRSLNPWNIWVDHQDSMAFRDAGWLQFYGKNNQEILDLILIAYRIAEEHKIWMPAMVCLDGFILSHTSALVSIPTEDEGLSFVHDFDPLIYLNPDKPFTHGALTSSADITNQRYSLMQGFVNAKVIYNEVASEYTHLTGRKYTEMVEITGNPDANIGIMALGTLGEEAEEAIEYLSKRGIQAKVIRPRVFRPFPYEEILKASSNLEKLVILDRAVSFGNGGQLAIETKSALYDAGLNIPVQAEIVGLGGTDVDYKAIAKIVEKK